MKKVFIAMCAMAAVMACTKTEATFEQPGEISFSPVSRYNTKAAVAPADGIGGQNVYMFANTMANEKYFENALFVPETGVEYNDLQVYKGNPAQFWPNATNLKFAGYTESGNVGTDANEVTASMTTWGTMTIEGYSQPYNFSNEQNNDLMWFFDAGTDGSDADTDPDGYGKSTTYVTPTMKHACSWITIKVKVADALMDTDATQEGDQPYWSNITVKNIKFETLNTTGIVSLAAAATWSDVNGAQSDVNIYDNETGTVVNEIAKVIDSSVPNNVIVIPQAPTTLAMTYSYNTPAGVSVTETKTGISLDYDGTDGTNTAWAAGTHYIYELTIGADEIKIAPKSTDWATGTGSGLSQNVK